LTINVLSYIDICLSEHMIDDEMNILVQLNANIFNEVENLFRGLNISFLLFEHKNS